MLIASWDCSIQISQFNSLKFSHHCFQLYFSSANLLAKIFDWLHSGLIFASHESTSSLLSVAYIFVGPSIFLLESHDMKICISDFSWFGDTFINDVLSVFTVSLDHQKNALTISISTIIVIIRGSASEDGEVLLSHGRILAIKNNLIL